MGAKRYATRQWEGGDATFAEERLNHMVRHAVLFAQFRRQEDLDALICNGCMLAFFKKKGFLVERPATENTVPKDPDPHVSVWESEGGSYSEPVDNGPTGPLRYAADFSGAGQRAFNERQQRVREMFRMHEASPDATGDSSPVGGSDPALDKMGI